MAFIRPGQGIRAIVTGTAILTLTACAGGRNTPEETIRTNVRTAPAELQLTCASETVTRLQLGDEQLLPISSGEVTPNVYRVDFNTKGGPAVCIIDGSGTVLSVGRA